ncbi:MAG: YciI family protein [Gammaproteobacteria bacterium]
MKYLCLICAETVMEQMTESDAAKHFDEYMAFTEAIKDSGHYLSCNRLLPANTAITLRVRNGKTTTTDGPFAETKEQLGGYFLIEARDLNEAIQVASRIPGAKLGCVEVRPVAEDEATLRAIGLNQADDACRRV